MYFAAASRCALMKFSYSSFGVLFSVFSCSVSNLFLNSNTYLSLTSLLFNRAQSQCLVVTVRLSFFRRLNRIFAKTSNLVIRNNSSPSIGVLQKTNVIYKFKCPLGDCISDNNNIYVGLTSTTLSRRLTMHLSDTSSIAQHLKKHSCPTTQLRKILTDNTTILEHQNNKQKLQILEALHIRNLQPTLNRINFQTSANVLKCL